MSRIADGELRRVHTDGDAASSGGDVVARQSALSPFIESTRCSQGERVGRYDVSGA